MVTALYVVIFLCILVLTALGMVWLSSRKKDKPEIKEEKVLDIKEPVYSFVECFKNNHRRFKIETNSEQVERRVILAGVGYTDYKLTDKVLGNVFKITLMSGGNWCNFSSYPEYLSLDEVRYIYKEITRFYDKRKQKAHSIKNTRAKRKADKEREQLMKDYCGGVE